MDGTLSSTPPRSLSSRPRVTPGVPAGGIAAIIVALGIIGWGFAAGDSGKDEGDDWGHRFHFEFDTDHASPVPPTPPMPPAAPRAPRAPDMRANVDAAEIERSVRDAMRDVDIDSTRMEALRAAREGLAEARQELQAARERLRAEGREIPAIAESALQAAEIGVAAAAGAADGALISQNGGDSFQKSFEGIKDVQLINIGGDITIERSSRNDKVLLDVEGGGKAMRAEVRNGLLTVTAPADPTQHTELHLSLPDQGDLTIVGLNGDLSVSGRGGKLSVQVIRGDVSVERLESLSAEIIESGSVSVQRVDGPLRFTVAGSGELSAERVGTAKLEVNGHANISLGRVNDALAVSVPGYADVDIGRVNGPVKVDFPGAGNVKIGEGRAEPLQATLSGAGNLEFDGTAENAQIVASGSGNVRIAHHDGRARVNNTGSGNVSVGD